MELTRLSLMNFRCFERRDFEFAERMNFFIGANAIGKTSVLEAICVLLRLQSPRVSSLGRIVRHGSPGFSVQGECNRHLLQFYFGSRRKKLAMDRQEQADATEYLRVGKLVYFGNSDMEIAEGSGDARRRFLDFAGMQSTERYRLVWKRYNRALRARNSLLKEANLRMAEVTAFNEPLASAGEELMALRSHLVNTLAQYAPEASSAISGAGENMNVCYVPGATPGAFAEELAKSFGEDLRLRVTTTGPHRDDLVFLLDGVDARNYASEGQQRTIVLALKLAHSRHLQAESGETPLLLFDDIFGELDPARRNGLFGAIPGDARCFITATTLDWLRQPAGRIWKLDETSASLAEISPEPSSPSSGRGG